MSMIVENYCELPNIIRKPMWQVWHKLMIRFDKDIAANFMNYGFENLNIEEQPIKLIREDEKNRYCIQLYDHLARNADLKNKDVLEVGSGRGGGASYIARYYQPKTYTGLDLSGSVIDFCNLYYNIPGLVFVKGVAEKEPFSNNSFDVVLNVESARCYSDLSIFFHEVSRVLRPTGYFLFADLMHQGEVGEMRSKLKKCGFEITGEQNITPNVIEALGKDTERRERLIHEKIPGFLKKSFLRFAATKGTERYDSFRNGKFEYWSFRLKKSA
ncbi:MAG: class I SAM-dependent methyltransferase [Bacteroidales bacterium]|nr:class I SAM-dependent methyltransferase [Bacteroidales bacterium]